MLFNAERQEQFDKNNQSFQSLNLRFAEEFQNQSFHYNYQSYQISNELHLYFNNSYQES